MIIQPQFHKVKAIRRGCAELPGSVERSDTDAVQEYVRAGCAALGWLWRRNRVRTPSG